FHVTGVQTCALPIYDNQDRVPFRQQNKAIGHAVRATYLYAGVADLSAEIRDTTLSNRLHNIWDDMIQTKMYITGGVGSLYDGTRSEERRVGKECRGG